ncbi:unnamed protein product [Ixodes hexagonus]
MPMCFAPGCTSGYYKSAEKRHFFRPPANDEQRAAWDRAIPRTDRLLTPTCRLCDLHFDSEDIVKTFKHNIRGEIVEIPRGKWQLAPGAVPRNFSDFPRYLLKRKAHFERTTTTGKKKCNKERPADVNGDAPLPCEDPKEAVTQPAPSELCEESETVIPKLASPENEKPPTCCLRKCRSGKRFDRNPEGRHYFKPPSDRLLFREWERRLGRSDWKPLTKTMHVCDLHFEPDDIIKGYEHVVNGEVIVLQKDRWRLKRTAVPSRLLGDSGTKQSPPTAPCVETKPSEKAPGTTIYAFIHRIDVPNTNNSASGALEPVCITTQPETVRFEDLASTFTAAEATGGWKTEVSDDSVLFYKLVVSEKRVASISRAVVVARDLTVCVNSNGRPVPPGLLVADIRKREDVNGLLNVVGRLRDCGGCPADQFPDVTTSLSAVKEHDVWYQKNCTVLTEANVCGECVKLRKLMRQRQKKGPPRPRNTRAAMKALKKKAVRASLATERMRLKLQDMKNEMAVFAKAIKVLPEEQQTAFREALCHFGEVCAMEEGKQEDEELVVAEDMQSDSACSSD